MQLSGGEGRHSEFLLNAVDKIQEKNHNDKIELPEGMVLPARTMEECIDFIYLAFNNSACFQIGLSWFPSMK